MNDPDPMSPMLDPFVGAVRIAWSAVGRIVVPPAGSPVVGFTPDCWKRAEA